MDYRKGGLATKWDAKENNCLMSAINGRHNKVRVFLAYFLHLNMKWTMFCNWLHWKPRQKSSMKITFVFINSSQYLKIDLYMPKIIFE